MAAMSGRQDWNVLVNTKLTSYTPCGSNLEKEANTEVLPCWGVGNTDREHRGRKHCFHPPGLGERVGTGGNLPVCRADRQLRIVVHVRPDVAQSKALEGLFIARRLLTAPS